MYFVNMWKNVKNAVMYLCSVWFVIGQAWLGIPLSGVFFQKPHTAVVHGKVCVNSTTAHTMPVQMKATSFKFLILPFFYPTPKLLVFLL